MPTNANPKGGSARRILKVKWCDQTWSARVVLRSRSHRVSVNLCPRTATRAEAGRVVWCAPALGQPASSAMPRADASRIHAPVVPHRFPLSSSENSLKP
jgi:hypothetical protein